MAAEHPDFIAVNLTPAMSGYFPTLYSWSQDDELGGFYEPYATGFGRYATWEEANEEGKRWAEAEGVAFHPATAELVAEAEARTERTRARFALIKRLRDEGLSLGKAYARAQAELPREPA